MYKLSQQYYKKYQNQNYASTLGQNHTQHHHRSKEEAEKETQHHHRSKEEAEKEEKRGERWQPVKD